MRLSLSWVTFLLWLVRNVYAATVITVDDQDPSIIYAPTSSSWGKINGPGVDAGGTHMMSSDPNATATLTRRFLNAHFWSARWPYLVTTDISIDGNNNFTLNLQDPNASEQPHGGAATVASSVVFSYAGTTTQEHTIVLSVHPGDLYVVLDQFTFDVEDDPIANTSTAPPIPGSTAAPSSASKSSTVLSASGEATTTSQASSTTSTNLGNMLKKPSSVPIIIAVIVVVLMLSLVGLIVFIVCRRRRRHKHARFLFESPFDWRKKRQESEDNVTSDRFDAIRSQSPLTTQANILPPAPTHSADHSLGGGTDDAYTTRADAPLHQATTVPTNALRVMNNAQSRQYPSGITLLTPLSKQPMPLSLPLHAAVNTSSGSEDKASLVADVNGSACRDLNGDSKEPDSKGEQWLTKKSRDHQSALYSPAPPPYQE